MKILVTVTGNEVDNQAIKLACNLAMRNKTQICAIYVVTIKRTLPVEAENSGEIEKARKVLSHIEDLAKEKNCRVETTLSQSREAGSAIIDKAVEYKAGLIIMGVKYQKRFGQFSLGSTVPYILKNAPCRVILYQQQATESED